MIVKVGDKTFYMDGFLKENLDRGKVMVEKDWDVIILYDGYEGSGKSVKAMQDCFYFDPTFNLGRVCFTPSEFTTQIKTALPGQAVMYDEAFTGLSARASMSIINRTLVKMLAEIRQKRLFVAIVMPSFFDVDRYVALWRSRALVHVYIGDKLERGYFAFYNMDRKKGLYVFGKKFYSYMKPTPNFRGRFTGAYVIDEKEYRNKKKDSLLKRAEIEEQNLIQEQVTQTIFRRVVDMEGVTNAQKAKIVGIPEGTYYYRLKNYKETGEYQ